MINIYNIEDDLILSVNVDDTSYRYRTIGGDHNLILKYSLAEHIELPVGAYVMYDGRLYTLKRPEDFKMQHTRCYDYTVTLESPQFNSKIWKFRNSVDGRLKFSLTAKPHEHLQMFVDNMNRRSSGWSVGDCIEASEKLINYDHDYCWDALGKMASEFNTEFEIVDKCVSLHKVEYHRNNPLSLSYGIGHGFTSGVGRSNSGDKPPVEILFVQGGSDNINPSKYGSKELKLPAGQTIAFDGQHFEGEEGYQASAARLYIVDDQGLSIRRADKALSSQVEDSLDASQVYPKRVGTVTSVITVDENNNFYDFVDNTIPADLNFEDCLIEGETMTVIFQSGMLSGREFEVKYIHNSINGKQARRFELVPQEFDGETMPNEVFKPVEDNTYAVFKCALPQGYIRDDTTKTGASWDMFREAVKYLYDNEEAKFTFTGTLDGLWAKKDWLNVGGRLVLGGCVLFRSKDFLPDGAIVRIVGIKDFINNPHSPTIELSNEIKSSSFGTDMANLESQEVHVDDNYRSALQFTKRRFRDAKETITMLESALLSNFTNSITPLSVQTMSMLVGDESLQFRFVTSKTEPNTVPHLITYDNALQQLTAAAGIMQHLTLGIYTLSSSHKASEYRFWDVSDYTSARLENPNVGYYLYIKASRSSQSAEFILSETAKKIDEDSAVYYFLVGILNREYDGDRSFVTLYGFTEILPGRMTTDIIISNDGKTYMNLATGEICGNIKFLSENDEYITLIEGGKIKTELIDVSELIARSVIVGEPDKQRVEITPSSSGNGSVKIYDENNNEVSVFEGQSYSSINDLYDSSTGDNCAILTRTSTKYGYGSGVTFGRGKMIFNAPNGASLTANPIYETIALSQAWYTSAPTEVTLKSGHIHAYAYAAAVSFQTIGNKPTSIVQLSNAIAKIVVRVDTFSDEAMQNLISINNITYASASASCETMITNDDLSGGSSTHIYPEKSQDSGTINIANKKVKIPAGWHRLTLLIQCDAQIDGSYAQVDWGFTSGARNDIAAAYKNDAYVSRYFSNGFCLGTRADNYILAYKTDTGMRFVMENSNIGFDFSQAGIRTRAKGTNWMPLPMLIYKASYNYVSSTNKYQLKLAHGYKSFNGTTLPATRTSKGLVTLTFPDSWITDLGSIGVENLLVQVNAHHQVIDARIESITTTSIKVAMSDDASLNDGDFGIIIYYLASE